MRWHNVMICGAFLAVSTGAAHAEFGFGTPATPEEIAGWNISIGRDGANLPAGSGDTKAGAAIYAERCVACHGELGEGGIGDRLVGGQGSLTSDPPVKTVGSYWPYATTLYDYINRAMPQDAQQSLTPDEVYALSAYLLHLNGIVAEGAVMDAKSLPMVQMPNRDGFVPDDRPDIGE
ncbi:MAG TPA: cytochrome c [Paracoccaceae bacterium]|nr:cytochrome c [Paracoccaceae bacterium]